MDWCYESAYAANSSFWNQATVDKRFKVGDPDINPALYGVSGDKQPGKFVVNLISRHINMIVGRQRQNRKSTITLPRFDNDELADDYNKALKYVENKSGFQEYFSQAFEGACDTGISLLHLYPDYNTDPISGNLSVENVSYNNFLIDTFFRKQDLSDCNFIWQRKWVSRDSAKVLLPFLATEIDKMKSGFNDGKFPLQAEVINMDLSNLFTYDEFYYRSFREAKMIEDPMSQETTEWFGDEKDIPQILAQQPWLKVRKVKKPTVKLAIALGGKVVYNGPNLLNVDRFPFVPLLCYHEPDIQSYAWRLRGVVRNLIPSQYFFNRHRTMQLQLVEASVNAGWIYVNGSLVDVKSLRQTGEGILIPLKAGFSPQDIQRIEPPAIPPSVFELSKALEDDISKISGVNEELLGAANDDKSGILSMLRQGAGLVTLQLIFDKADYSQRIFGELIVEAMIKNFSEGKLRAILGKDPNPGFFSSLSLDYGIAVEEGNFSATQRQTELQQLLYFKEMGIEIPTASILKTANITNKKDLLETMEAQEKQKAEQEQAQAQQQSQMAELDSNSKMVEAYTKGKLDLAKEQESKAKAEQLLTQSTVDVVNASSTLEKDHLEKMQKYIDVVRSIKDDNKEDANIQQQRTIQ